MLGHKLGGNDQPKMEEYLEVVDLDSIDLQAVILRAFNPDAVNLEAVNVFWRRLIACVMEAKTVLIC
jgi:hypothetical protein